MLINSSSSDPCAVLRLAPRPLAITLHASAVPLSTSECASTDRRRTIRLENYWLSLRHCDQGRFLMDFQPTRNPVSWHNCFLAYFHRFDAEPVFDHIGASIIVLFKPDRTNIPDQEWLIDAIALHCGNMSAALTSATPVRREGQLNRPNGIVAFYRSLLLPFIDAKQSPAYVMGAVTYCLRDSAGMCLNHRGNIQ